MIGESYADQRALRRGSALCGRRRASIAPRAHSGAAALLSAAASTMLEARAEHRPGVRQLEHVARAASQLRHDLAPPARRPRAPARQQRGAARAQVRIAFVHRLEVQVWCTLVVVVGDSSKKNRRQASQNLGKIRLD